MFSVTFDIYHSRVWLWFCHGIYNLDLHVVNLVTT